MKLLLRIFVATQLFQFPEVFSCEEWEYETHGQCCPKCGTGYRVHEHCTATSGTSCVPCTNRTYMDHPNGLAKCFRCHVCDKGSNLRVKEDCTYQRNTACACREGYYCTSPAGKSCERCKKHTVAPPGQRVTEAGTENSDTKFVPCPPRTFSSANMSCSPWTNCRELGMEEVQAGSPTSDAVCGPPPSSVPVAAIVLLVLGAVVVAAGVALLLAKRTRKRIAKKGPTGGEKKEEPNGDYLPVPESGPPMVVPMQETGRSPGEPAYTVPHVSITFG